MPGALRWVVPQRLFLCALLARMGSDQQQETLEPTPCGRSVPWRCMASYGPPRITGDRPQWHALLPSFRRPFIAIQAPIFRSLARTVCFPVLNYLERGRAQRREPPDRHRTGKAKASHKRQGAVRTLQGCCRNLCSYWSLLSDADGAGCLAGCVPGRGVAEG
jgi:hypothetical protein